MAELRRLMIEPKRLADRDRNGCLVLRDDERHYLRRVLRLRPGAPVAVVDGRGHLWEGWLQEEGQLLLPGSCTTTTPAKTPQLGLAIALVRRGMDDVMRMACELGVDCIQPLQAERSTPQADYKPERWQLILKEAVEQCERLWMPQLLPLASTGDWWTMPGDHDSLAIATTRLEELTALEPWLQRQTLKESCIWLAIGPEGGWDPLEQAQALREGWSPISLSEDILRSSTAAIAGVTTLSSWRRTTLSTEQTHC
ncbi:16S rRNA (uracil(1498)-N(3))-methyltransferase [Synechococcus sp. Cu2B8-bc1011]|uniref:16S rRNA (uracil(1498)-N(3))-methyltransferase n=1 Tax=Synechococcus sp. Cu2B8-bc1011 TaxID=3093725 RepID=UPI0039AEF0BF